MIRAATESDLPRLIEMGSRSLREGPYKDQIEDNPEQAAKLGLEVIRSRRGMVLVAEEAGALVGLLGFIVTPHYFSGLLTGQEIMWWVEPEHRRSMIGVCLIRACERMARDLGAKRMQFTAPTREVAAAYEAMGYTALEVGYQKILHN
jgi:GNAT superfamily N-acetyltransferase